MNNLFKKILVLFLLATIVPSVCWADNRKGDFDFLLVLTQQNMDMDWWFAVPAQFGPNVSQVSEVTKGEFVNIIPIFNNYGLTENKEANITYSVEIIAPDGAIDEAVSDIDGYSGEVPGAFLLPAIGRLAVSFDPEDMFGEYDVRVTAFDHIKNQKSSQNQKISLQKFGIEKQDLNLDKWFLSYPSAPKPSLALTAFTNSPRPYFDDDGTPLWSALWLYKNIYSENEFLIPHTIDFYKIKASKQQKKDILLLFHILNRLDEISIEDSLQAYAKSLKTIAIPDPYQEITTGSQLDMLWAEYFATSKIKPIKQILKALNLSAYSGTIEKYKSGELEKTDETVNKLKLEAVFQSAIWSIMSNCKQSELLFQYCVGLYESKELNVTEKRYLGFMLRKVSEEKQKAIQENQADGK